MAEGDKEDKQTMRRSVKDTKEKGEGEQNEKKEQDNVRKEKEEESLEGSLKEEEEEEKNEKEMGEYEKYKEEGNAGKENVGKEGDGEEEEEEKDNDLEKEEEGEVKNEGGSEEKEEKNKKKEEEKNEKGKNEQKEEEEKQKEKEEKQKEENKENEEKENLEEKKNEEEEGKNEGENEESGDTQQAQSSAFPPITLVLLGESGSGKSASGNTILGENKFASRATAGPLTIQCQKEEGDVYGTWVTVIDTPDFSDNEMQHKTEMIDKCREMCDVCVYLLVIQIGRFTEWERDILNRLEKTLGKIRDQTIILFTYGDDLKSGQSIKHYVNNTNKHLQKLIKQCGKRYHVFNNKDRDEREKQVQELMGKTRILLESKNASVKSSGGLIPWPFSLAMDSLLMIGREHNVHNDNGPTQ